MNTKAQQNKLPTRLIIFDGACSFCNAAINFIIKRDPQAKFTFTTIQGVTGIELLFKLGIDPSNPDTFVLIKQGEVFLKSNAALEISRELTGAWRLAYYFRRIPLFIRDAAYSLIAKNRYKLFQKRDQCMIPWPDIKARFID